MTCPASPSPALPSPQQQHLNHRSNSAWNHVWLSFTCEIKSELLGLSERFPGTHALDPPWTSSLPSYFSHLPCASNPPYLPVAPPILCGFMAPSPTLCLAGSSEVSKFRFTVTLPLCFHSTWFILSSQGQWLHCSPQTWRQTYCAYGEDRPKDLHLTPWGHVSFGNYLVLDLCLVAYPRS